MQKILTPFVVSTSGYNSPDVKWTNQIVPPVAAVICRASLGTIQIDESFPHYWPQWDALQWPRGAYHYLLNGEGGAHQAENFVDCVESAGGFHPCDRVVLDAEESEGLSLIEMLDFYTKVSVLAPVVPQENYLIYSRANILNPLKFGRLSAAQKTYWHMLCQWAAGYPDDINGWNFPALAHFYQADQTRFGPAVIVQYMASAFVPGISLPDYLSVECNAIDPDYLEDWRQQVASFYGSTPQPLPEPSTVSGLGVFLVDGSQKIFKPAEA